jgi:hypothetical protein
MVDPHAFSLLPTLGNVALRLSLRQQGARLKNLYDALLDQGAANKWCSASWVELAPLPQYLDTEQMSGCAKA